MPDETAAPPPPAQDSFVQGGVAEVKRALAAQPYRGTPHWEDLHAMAEAILRHLWTWRSGPAPDDDEIGRGSTQAAVDAPVTDPDLGAGDPLAQDPAIT